MEQVFRKDGPKDVLLALRLALGLGTEPKLRPQRRGFTAIALLVALLSVAVFVYSPWHQHSPNSNQVCSLSQYGFTSGLEAGAGVPLIPPTRVARLHSAGELPQAGAELSTDSYGRAPPA